MTGIICRLTEKKIESCFLSHNSSIRFYCTDSSLLMTHRGGLSFQEYHYLENWRRGSSFILPWGPKILLTALIICQYNSLWFIRPGLEPSFYRIRGEFANHYTIGALYSYLLDASTTSSSLKYGMYALFILIRRVDDFFLTEVRYVRFIHTC